MDLREGTLFGDMRSIIAPAMCGTGVFPGPVVSPSVGIASAGVGWRHEPILVPVPEKKVPIRILRFVIRSL